VQLKYCPTEKMIADYWTKPLVGAKFHYFRHLIMNFPGSPRRSVLEDKILNEDLNLSKISKSENLAGLANKNASLASESSKPLAVSKNQSNSKKKKLIRKKG
jgi:hypothetical protein